MARRNVTPIALGLASLLLLGVSLRAESPGLTPARLSDPLADASPVSAESDTEPVAQDFWGQDGESCECGSLSRWTVDANALYLSRRVAPVPLINDDATGAGLLSTSSLDLSAHAGMEFGLTRHGDNGNALEMRYAGVDRWDAQTRVPTNAGDLLQINAAIPLFSVAGTAIDASYASEWHSFEFNGRHELCQQRLALLAGFRYVELDEGWSFTLVDGDPPLGLNTSTRNRLYGFQLGGEGVLWDRGGRLSLDGSGKAGVYSNFAAQDSLYGTGDAALAANDAQASTAFLGELGLTGKYRITDRFSARGGYRLLWINGVALAPDQLAASDFFFGRGIDTSGEAFFHGAFVGFEYVR
jgi:hypothetical protein